MRAAVNVTTGDLEVLARMADARREIEYVAERLFHERTSRRAGREDLGRRLNAVAVSLRTIELLLEETGE